jgi:enoyl-CoA hydratase
MTYKNIIVEKKQGIGYLKINRPKALNALNMETILELKKALKDLENDTNIKVIILTGEGKAFIAGADIKEMANLTTLEAKKFSEIGHSLLSDFEKSRLPIIAAINGYALGGGCETLLACDICIASKNAKIGQPEINLGIHPGFGGTQRLPRVIGALKAKELLFTGRTIEADEAENIGLVNMVVEGEKLMGKAEEIAGQIAKKSSVPTAFIKELVNRGMNIDLENANSLEISYFSSSFSTDDQIEGMTAFVEKRKPSFKDK